MEPRAGTSSTAFGRICPNATTTPTSGENARRRAGHSGSRTRAGWRMGSPAASARRLYEALFLDTLLDAIASDGRQTVDEQHAVQVIDLVLNHLGSQPLRLERNRPSCLVLGRYTDPLAP